MKREGILNESLLKVIGGLGHTDIIVVCDVGLPIPSGVEKVDLAVCKGTPGFMQVLKPLFNEMVIEKIIIASEIRDKNAGVLRELQTLAHDIPFEEVSHEEFKVICGKAKAAVRTGEATPYANVIIQAGVNF